MHDNKYVYRRIQLEQAQKWTKNIGLFFRLGVELGGLGSAPLPLQRGRDPLKISPRQLIRERQAVAAEMFVVVRLLWLQQCTGGEGPGHVWALWSIALRSLWNRARLKHQRVFRTMIWLSRVDRMRCVRMQERNLQIHVTGRGLTGLNWRRGWKRVTGANRLAWRASGIWLPVGGASDQTVWLRCSDDPLILYN